MTVRLTIFWLTLENRLSFAWSIFSRESVECMLPILGDRASLENGLKAISFPGKVLFSTPCPLFLLLEDLFRERFVDARLVRKTLKAGRLPTITATKYTS